jgi:hypothetical protein
LWKNAKALRKISQRPKLLAAYPNSVGEAVWRVEDDGFAFIKTTQYFSVGAGLMPDLDLAFAGTAAFNYEDVPVVSDAEEGTSLHR